MKKNNKTFKKELKSSDFNSILNEIKNDINYYFLDENIDEVESFCRICGFEYDQENSPWRKVNGSWIANYELCVCCNVHYGYEDTSIISVKEFRKNWILDGAKFAVVNIKPKDWNLKDQLKNIHENWV